jgi:secreted trypsin-like serine protease
LTGIAEDNRAALKRLTSMISHLLDNDVNMRTNENNNDGKQHIQNMQHTNSSSLILLDFIVNLSFYGHFSLGIHPENDTLHVSFGMAADPNRYPWVVAIRGNDRDRCGGTLIDDQHVLTAAHCIGKRTTTVLLGSHLYNGGEEVKTSFECVHSAYSSSGSLRNDLAIIRLAKPATVRLPKRISTINLCNPNHNLNTTISSNTINLWMVGWGFKNNNTIPDELQEAQVTLADRTMCKESNRYTDICVQSRSNTSLMGFIYLTFFFE